MLRSKSWSNSYGRREEIGAGKSLASWSRWAVLYDHEVGLREGETGKVFF